MYLSFKNILILCLCVWLCAPECRNSWRPEEGTRLCGADITGSYRHLTWVLETKLRSSAEKHVPSYLIAPSFVYFHFGVCVFWCSQRPEKSARCPGAGVIGRVSHQAWVRKTSTLNH